MSQVENYMRLAKNAFEVDNYEEAYTYSTKVLEYEPDNWEALCIKGISTTAKARMIDPRFNEMIATIRTAYYQIPEQELQKISVKFATFAISYYTHRYEQFNPEHSSTLHSNLLNQQASNKFMQAALQSMHLLGLAFTIFPNSEYALQIVKMYKDTSNVLYRTLKQLIQCEYILYVAEKFLKEQNPGYQSQNFDSKIEQVKAELEKSKIELQQKEKELETAKQHHNSGCFIATAVYGDYEAPEVLVLRRFRDNVLGQSVLGRTFIRTYYATSPRIADWLRFHDSIKGGVKKLLDRFVDYLRDKE